MAHLSFLSSFCVAINCAVALKLNISRNFYQVDMRILKFRTDMKTPSRLV
jgi:hypothetical protein